MSDVAPPAAQFADDAEPLVLGRNLAAASRLLASAGAFFFLAFVFAYFYLRSLDNGGMWRPKGVEPSHALGAVVLIAVVGCAVLVRRALAGHEAGKAAAARLALSGALGLGVAAIALQIVDWFAQGFGPTEGGYASVFFGWTGVLAVFLLIAVLWLEVVLATAIRFRDAPRTAGPDPLALAGAELDALSFFWTFLAGVAALTFVILYVL